LLVGVKQPYWPDNLMKRHIRPVAKANGIHKNIGWLRLWSGERSCNQPCAQAPQDID
jgi:hypothetical protein